MIIVTVIMKLSASAETFVDFGSGKTISTFVVKDQHSPVFLKIIFQMK